MNLHSARAPYEKTSMFTARVEHCFFGFSSMCFIFPLPWVISLDYLFVIDNLRGNIKTTIGGFARGDKTIYKLIGSG